MSNEITLQSLSEKIDRLTQINLIGVKNDLQLDEAAIYTGLSEGYLYRLARGGKLCHYKNSRRIYFNKTELDKWIENRKVNSDKDISTQASTYVATRRKSSTI